jgi:hypothetical protein
MRYLGAVALLAVGAVHLERYLGGYNGIPTIGPLFLLNAIGSAVIAVGLLVPLDRILAARRADAGVGLLAAGAVAIAVTSLIMLFVSESTSLFGFTESGYGAPMIVAILAEAATVLLLAPVAAIRTIRSLSNSSGPSEPSWNRRTWKESRTTT